MLCDTINLFLLFIRAMSLNGAHWPSRKAFSTGTDGTCIFEHATHTSVARSDFSCHHLTFLYVVGGNTSGINRTYTPRFLTTYTALSQCRWNSIKWEVRASLGSSRLTTKHQKLAMDVSLSCLANFYRLNLCNIAIYLPLLAWVRTPLFLFLRSFQADRQSCSIGIDPWSFYS